jgi:hypothetical protein
MRRALRTIRCAASDRIIMTAGRFFYRRMAGADFLKDRIGYLYSPPLRYADFGERLSQSGLRLVADVPLSRQSVIELHARRCVRRMDRIRAK